MALWIFTSVPAPSAIIFAELDSNRGPRSHSLRVVLLDIVDDKVGDIRYCAAHFVGLSHQFIEAGVPDAADHDQCVAKPELGVPEIPAVVALLV